MQKQGRQSRECRSRVVRVVSAEAGWSERGVKKLGGQSREFRSRVIKAGSAEARWSA